MTTKNIIELRSPEYLADFGNWADWRAAVAADDAYIRNNLQQLPAEKVSDYIHRKKNTPTPAYIKATLREVLTGIYVQMESTTRSGGVPSLQSALTSAITGVDGAGTSMNYFIIMHVLRELLIMKRVGIFVDRPPLPPDASLQDAANAPPYMYIYTAEQILGWTVRSGKLIPDEVLLQREVPVYYDGTKIKIRTKLEYLYAHQIADKTFQFDIFNHEGKLEASHIQERETLPIVILEISDSLVQDVLGHQCALLNLGSSNISFAIASNLAVYTEQADMAWLMAQLKQSQLNEDDAENTDAAGEITVGLTRGRRYPQNAERPEFVTPDTENLTRALELYKYIQEDIRRVMLQTIQNISVRGLTTATSLMQSQASVSNGLSALAALLEKGEKHLAQIWADYESEPNNFTVKYPSDFHIISKKDRDELVVSLAKMRDLVPSRTFREQVTKTLTGLILGPHVSSEDIKKIQEQIMAAPILLGDPTIIKELVIAGILPKEYAGIALNLPKDSAIKANAEHAERLQRISEAQSRNAPSAARGNPDGIDDAVDEKTSSQSADSNPDGGKRVHG